MNIFRKKFSKLTFNLIVSVFFTLFVFEGFCAAQLFPYEFEEEVDARDANQEGINFLADIITDKWGGIGIVASKNHTATVDVDGKVTASKLAAYVGGSNDDDDPKTPGTATLTVQGLQGDGIQAFTVESGIQGGVATLISNGDVSSANGRGGMISCYNNGECNLEIYGNLTGNVSGLDFDLTVGGTADALVTGIISGTYSVRITYGAVDNATLTVWKLQKGNTGSFVGDYSNTNEQEREPFAKRIKYIIKHDADVAPKKANGSNLDVSHDYPIAKEGERVIITPEYDGVTITKAYNNGVEITDIDENGNFYVDVQRGGGIDLSIETESIGDKTPINNASITFNKRSYTYNGQIQKPILTVTVNNKTLTSNTDYTVTYSNENPKNAGDYTLTVTGKGNYTGTKSATFTINKALNPMELNGKVVKVKALALSKKAQSRKIAKAIKITNAKGTLSYQKVKGKKKIVIDEVTGKITIKKGLKKGKYKVTVNVTALGDTNYKQKTESVIFTVNVN